MTKKWLKEIFGKEKVVIGMVHFLPLPSTPLYDEKGGMKRIYHHAMQDIQFLQEEGVDGILFCNEGDRPYTTSISLPVCSAFSVLVGRLHQTIKIPFGINVLLDPLASISIAYATGASFIRTFLTNAFVGDFGIMETKGAAVLRLRRDLFATGVRIIANITAGFAAPLAERPIEESARGAVFVGLADALCISGPAAGVETDIEIVKRVHRSLPETPIFIGTGVSKENVHRMLEHSDGVIVGTSLKRGGKTLNSIDRKRVRQFMAVVHSKRGY